jgi:cell division cycle 20-like protein 1 (cofactor of APC complex)
MFSDSNYSVKLKDLAKEIEIFKFDALKRRFLTMESISDNIILLGSDNSYVDFYDIRTKTKLRNLYKHDSNNEVCKLRYSKCNNQVISGGNDNKIITYDIRQNKIANIFQHNAAIKGLALNSTEDILVSGGGTHDKTIKMWDMKKHVMIHQLLTESQITNIEFLADDSFLVSSGYIANNVVLYKIDGNTFKKSVALEKHDKRILFMAKTHYNNFLASCSTDGIVKVWKVGKFLKKETFENNGIFCAIR